MLLQIWQRLCLLHDARGGELFFSHGIKHSKGLCILIKSHGTNLIIRQLRQNSVNYYFFEWPKLITLFSIYAPNNQANQLRLCKSLTTALLKRQNLLHYLWAVTGTAHCLKKTTSGVHLRSQKSTVREMFDFADIQRVQHPKLPEFI